MAEYKQIKIRIWQDNWFLSLSPEEKLLWIYLLTNQNSHISGLYELPKPLISPLTGIKDWNKILLKFVKDGKIYYKNSWIFINNYQKHQPISDNVKDNVNKSIKKYLEENKEILTNIKKNQKPLKAPCEPLSEEKEKEKGERKGERKDNTKVLDKSFGREDINQVMNYLKTKIKSLDGSIKENRRYAKLLIDRLKKDYPDYNSIKQIQVLIDYGLKDKFHSKNITSFKYLYYNCQKIVNSIKQSNKPSITVVG